MKKVIGKNETEFKMFADYWKLYQDFYIPEEQDLYWEELLAASEKFVREYKNEYAVALMMAYIDSREKLMKDK